MSRDIWLAGRMHREAKLRELGIHRVRRRSADTGKVETVWCGLETPCTCAAADGIGSRAAELRREAGLRAHGIHRIRRRSAASGRTETAWCGIDAPCNCAARTEAEVSRRMQCD